MRRIGVSPNKTHLASDWKITARLVGWLPVVGSAVAISVGLILAATSVRTAGSPSAYQRVVAGIVSLVCGLQAAFVLSPSDEPGLEVLLTYPGTASRILLERLTMLVVMQGSMAFLGNAAGLILLVNGDFLLGITGWVAPCVCLSGVAAFITQLTRQGAFGALLTMMMWGSMIAGGDFMVARWPSLLPLHLFLRPDTVSLATYLLNRATLILAGLALSARAAQLLRNEEHALGIRSAPSDSRKGQR